MREYEVTEFMARRMLEFKNIIRKEQEYAKKMENESKKVKKAI